LAALAGDQAEPRTLETLFKTTKASMKKAGLAHIPLLAHEGNVIKLALVGGAAAAQAPTDLLEQLAGLEPDSTVSKDATYGENSLAASASEVMSWRTPLGRLSFYSPDLAESALRLVVSTGLLPPEGNHDGDE